MYGFMNSNKLFGIFRRRSARSKYSYHLSPSFQCYACTQAGGPDFLSAARDQTQQPICESSTGKHPSTGLFRTIFDPRSKRVQKWNRYILLARGIALAIDPLFFYALSIGQNGSTCLLINWNVVTVVTAIRTCVDAVHICHMWLQLRLAYVSKESLVIGCGKLVWDSRSIAAHYFQSFHGFWFDVIVILPFPQVVFWLVVHRLIMKEQIELMMSIILLVFLLQFLSKVYHFLSLMKSMKKVTGYLFGSIWWGFGINILAYFIASHVSGGCWYMLGIQRVVSCLRKHSNGHNFSLSCSHSNSTPTFKASMCFDENGTFPYGIYGAALQVISSSSTIVKILYPINWGLMMLSQVGNPLAPTSNWLELIFSIYMVLIGFMLFTLMIGSIQIFLHALLSRKRKMEQRGRDLEWWMRRRRLPSHLVQRVRRYETEKWRSIHGEDEMEFISGLPLGLRRDIKRFLCLDLIKKVPLFHKMDDLILENICDRVKALVFSKDEKIIREGDPVHMIIFIVRGRVKSCQKLSKGKEATSILEPGGYLGDELLSWSLRRPFIERLPPSSATFTCLETTEAFALDANHLLYIADHFRRKFNHERLKRAARYYSSNWRTWAAVKLQFAWRQRRERMMISAPMNMNDGNRDYRLRRFAAVFMSIRPRDHLDIE